MERLVMEEVGASLHKIVRKKVHQTPKKQPHNRNRIGIAWNWNWNWTRQLYT